jgi:hypothetical protein
VHDGGVLITLGEIPPGRTAATIEAQRYERTDVAATYRISLQRVARDGSPLGRPRAERAVDEGR